MLLCYVAAIVITGFVPLSPSLEIPLALGGWLCFAGLLVWGKTRRRRYSSRDLLRAIIWPVPLAIVFGVLVVLVSYFALAWHVPAACRAGSMNCFKGYEWSVQQGSYFHVTPDGSSAQFSQSVYVAEVGTYLRSAPDPLYLAYLDFNADGRIDVTDLGAFAARYQMVLP